MRSGTALLKRLRLTPVQCVGPTARSLTARRLTATQAHGTGTVHEARSIGSVYGRGARSEALPIGSVKANIGHLEAAAGVAGVIKALLILQSGLIPPHLLVGYPNPDIPFEALNLRLLRDSEPLQAPRVAVNAFGYGGSNAHVILGPPPEPSWPKSAPAESGPLMLPLSAQSAEALADWVARVSEQIEIGASPADLQYTLARRRGHRSFRSAVWIDRSGTPALIAAQLRAALKTRDGLEGSVTTDRVPRALFVFSGMGAVGNVTASFSEYPRICRAFLSGAIPSRSTVAVILSRRPWTSIHPPAWDSLPCYLSLRTLNVLHFKKIDAEGVKRLVSTEYVIPEALYVIRPYFNL